MRTSRSCQAARAPRFRVLSRRRASITIPSIAQNPPAVGAAPIWQPPVVPVSPPPEPLPAPAPVVAPLPPEPARPPELELEVAPPVPEPELELLLDDALPQMPL